MSRDTHCSSMRRSLSARVYEDLTITSHATSYEGAFQELAVLDPAWQPDRGLVWPLTATLCKPAGHLAFLLEGGLLLLLMLSYSWTSTRLWLLFCFVFVQHQKGQVPECALRPNKATNHNMRAKTSCLYFQCWCAFTSVGPEAYLSVGTYKQELHICRWWMWVCKQTVACHYHDTFANHLQDLCP